MGVVVLKPFEELLSNHWSPNARIVRPIQAGLSNSLVFQVEWDEAFFCLKGLPERLGHSRLQWIHNLEKQATQKGLDCLPVAQSTRANATYVSAQGRLWELSTWLPGESHEVVNPRQLAQAMRCLAQIHVAWDKSEVGAPTIVNERRKYANECRRLLRELDWEAVFSKNSQFSWLNDVRNLVAKSTTKLVELEAELTTWEDASLRIQPVLRDVWSDHVLFVADSVSGLIDIHAANTGTVAGDISRLLASWRLPTSEKSDDWSPDERVRAGWEEAISHYESIRPLSDAERRLIGVLDDAACLLTPWVWIRWLLLEQRRFENWEKVEKRVKACFRRFFSR
jgi:Ser/Thr protein kinase RdoA (MazF antagonist)